MTLLGPGRLVYLACATASVALLGSCAHSAKKRFSNEYDCPKSEVSETNLGGGAWRVSGCGVTAIYNCEAADPEHDLWRSGWDTHNCRKESSESTYAPPARRAQPAVVEAPEVERAVPPRPIVASSGKGVLRHDRFKKDRALVWNDIVVRLNTGNRGLSLEFSILVEKGGKVVAADELTIELHLAPLPASADRFSACHGVDFLLDEHPVALESRADDKGRVTAVIPLALLERFAAASAIEGRVCRDEFRLGESHRKQLQRYWNSLQRRLSPSETVTPGFDEPATATGDG